MKEFVICLASLSAILVLLTVCLFCLIVLGEMIKVYRTKKRLRKIAKEFEMELKKEIEAEKKKKK